MQIKKALITAAGHGTRFLPISKTVQKEMLPILNRPTIDYLVADCIKAGIEEIIIVENDSTGHLIKKYFSRSVDLEEYLIKSGKSELLETARQYSDVKFSFIYQTKNDPYGTAIPVKLGREFLQNEEAFVVLMGDDFLFNPDDTSEVALMIEHFKKHSASALATCINKPTSELGRYGVAKTIKKNETLYLETLIEKPRPEEAPSNLVNISKYIFTSEIFDIIENQSPNPDTGELYITDSITTLAQTGKVVIYEPTGEYLDTGTVAGWLKANITVASHDSALRGELQQFLVENGCMSFEIKTQR